MDQNHAFELKTFMPYLLNQAAEASSREFEGYYKSKYGMLRTEWRVIFHLGRYGAITAKDICDKARLHKTKVSRAVQALETKGYLKRERLPEDRRHETLDLTASGQRVFEDLCEEAKRFDGEMLAAFSDDEKDAMRQILIRIAQL